MTKNTILLLIILSIAFLNCSSKDDDSIIKEAEEELAFIPFFYDDFESYQDGSSLSNSKPFDAAGNTTASTEQSYSGKTSAKMEIREGNKGGFGKWGGIIPIKPNIPKGGEIWVSLKAFWPINFQFTASPWMKFLRLHNKTGAGKNGGYNDLYIHKADGPESVLRCIKEIHNKWNVYNGAPIPRATWETYEMYLFIDNVPVDDGGKGRMRIWRDGKIIFDRTDVPTITEANGVIDYFYLFTYWNNENPPNNYMYIDDVIIATDANPPTKKDEDGNLFIGN